VRAQPSLGSGIREELMLDVSDRPVIIRRSMPGMKLNREAP
jgi:hypothetical protein